MGREVKVYRSDPTEYKQSYIKTSIPKEHHAGKPLKYTPIGEW